MVVPTHQPQNINQKDDPYGHGISYDFGAFEDGTKFQAVEKMCEFSKLRYLHLDGSYYEISHNGRRVVEISKDGIYEIELFALENGSLWETFNRH